MSTKLLVAAIRRRTVRQLYLAADFIWVAGFVLALAVLAYGGVL